MGRSSWDHARSAVSTSVNAAYQTELIKRGKPWRCIDDLELATAEWVAWYNQERLFLGLAELLCDVA
jgi:putative transposase